MKLALVLMLGLLSYRLYQDEGRIDKLESNHPPGGEHYLSVPDSVWTIRGQNAPTFYSDGRAFVPLLVPAEQP